MLLLVLSFSCVPERTVYCGYAISGNQDITAKGLFNIIQVSSVRPDHHPGIPGLLQASHIMVGLDFRFDFCPGMGHL